MFRFDQRRFCYRASAVGVSGTFKKPYREFLPSQASCALGIEGGIASSVVKEFSYRDILSFSSAASSILGQPGDTPNVFTTLNTVTVEDFNVMNMLSCDGIVARLSSRSFMEKTPVPSAFVAFGSQFQDLRIAGQPVSVEFDEDILCAWETYEQARTGIEERDHVKIPEGSTYCTSIVSAIGPIKSATVTGNRIDIPHFGSIYLGEYYISPTIRRLQMIRIEFGCPVDGGSGVGTPENNGEPYPPLAG
jgi:hypothetical protein